MSDGIDAFDALDENSLPASPDIIEQVEPVKATAKEAAVVQAVKNAADEPVEETVTKVAKAQQLPPEVEEVAKAKEAPETVVAAPTPGVRSLKFFAGDTAVPVPETAEINWKIDGKSERVKVRDLLDNYAGKVSYDRKFNEFAQQRKGMQSEQAKFEADRNRHRQLITDMHKAATENRMFDAVSNMLEMNGLADKISAREYITQLRDGLAKQARELDKMSPEQRALYEIREEQDFLRSQMQRDVKQRTQEQVEQAFRVRVEKAIETAKSSPEEFVQTRDWLVNKFTQDKMDVSQITPEFIADHIANVRDYKTAQEAMEAVDPSLTKNSELWERAVALQRENPEWTKEDLKDVLRLALGAKRSQSASNKLNRANVSTAAKGAVKGRMATKSGNPAEDYRSFSRADLEW